jgi:hypothetical protein
MHDDTDSATAEGARAIAKPLIVLGAPRSGTTMIFQALSTHPDLWSLYRESQSILNSYFPTTMEPGASAVVEHAEADTIEALRRRFFADVGNAEASMRILGRGVPLLARSRAARLLAGIGRSRKSPPIRIVEKTPDNCFRIPLLLDVFPDALFVQVVRDPRGSIASIYHGWVDEPRFRRFPLPAGYTIEGYEGAQWCFGLPPGWQRLDGATLMEVCAFQWRLYNEYCFRDLPREPGRVFEVRYEDAAARPGAVLDDLARWADLDPAPLRRFSEKLPVVNTWSRPRSDKWRTMKREVELVLPSVSAESERLGYPVG